MFIVFYSELSSPLQGQLSRENLPNHVNFSFRCNRTAQPFLHAFFALFFHNMLDVHSKGERERVLIIIREERQWLGKGPVFVKNTFLGDRASSQATKNGGKISDKRREEDSFPMNYYIQFIIMRHLYKKESVLIHPALLSILCYDPLKWDRVQSSGGE